jgi:hypothetical protein
VFKTAGAVALGTNNTRDCPAETFRMTTAAECAAAAALTARPFFQFASSAAVPGGCGWLTAGGSFYFNADPNGNGGVNFFAQPVCAGAPDRSLDK